MKTLIIITIALLCFACQSGYKGEALVVASKELSDLEEYKYYYELECDYRGIWKWQDGMYLHSNQNWDVGDTIHIGARWGKEGK